MHADPETMAGFLARVAEKYGSMVEYARDIGIAEADVARLRERLVEA
jgi:hypothetical protein